jgi:hypothetical protein
MTPDEFPNLRTAARIETSHVKLCYNIWFATARARVSGSHNLNLPQHGPSFSFMLKGEVRFEKEGENALGTL